MKKRMKKVKRQHILKNPSEIGLQTSDLIQVEYYGETCRKRKSLDFILIKRKRPITYLLKMTFKSPCKGKVVIKEY
jgi:hypothetical protein